MNQRITDMIWFAGLLLLLANYPRHITDLQLRWWIATDTVAFGMLSRLFRDGIDQL